MLWLATMSSALPGSTSPSRALPEDMGLLNLLLNVSEKRFTFSSVPAPTTVAGKDFCQLGQRSFGAQSRGEQQR